MQKYTDCLHPEGSRKRGLFPRIVRKRTAGLKEPCRNTAAGATVNGQEQTGKGCFQPFHTFRPFLNCRQMGIMSRLKLSFISTEVSNMDYFTIRCCGCFHYGLGHSRVRMNRLDQFMSRYFHITCNNQSGKHFGNVITNQMSTK